MNRVADHESSVLRGENFRLSVYINIQIFFSAYTLYIIEERRYIIFGVIIVEKMSKYLVKVCSRICIYIYVGRCILYPH